ncbi:hypothetical protein [Caldivirga sp. UBA161]|uniref:hypothetical protein n=1 Tax=Caldivirga sp. UBA161 TaxID=1915569 RepID=UPI0025BC6CAD|nr:hypothetical protein [Caldivirga sp. UBA161]
MSLDVEVVESRPGLIEVEDYATIRYRIVSVKAAKVGNGYSIMASIDIFTRFSK